MFAGGATDEVGPVRRAFGWESKRYGRRHDLLFRCRWTANSRVKSFWRLRVRRRGRRVAARAVFTVRSAAWYCLRARCAGGTGGNCLIFTVLAAAVPGAVRRCLRAHRHAGCAAATVACTVGSAGPACLGFCVTFLSLLSSVLTVCPARACRRGAWGAQTCWVCGGDGGMQGGSPCTRRYLCLREPVEARVRTDVLRNT